MRLNCGDTCPKSGSYKVIDGNGKVINWVHVEEGETMPPHSIPTVTMNPSLNFL